MACGQDTCRAPARAGTRVSYRSREFPVNRTTYYVLFFMDMATRSVHIAGMTPDPDTPWMMQIARNLKDVDGGFLRGKRYLILDRDTKYSDAFRSFLVREGTKDIRLPPTFTQSECFRRTLCALYQRGMLAPDDLCRTGIASARDQPVHGPLPCRAESSRARKPPAAAHLDHRASRGTRSTAPTPWRNAQLLLSRSRLNLTEFHFWTFRRQRVPDDHRIDGHAQHATSALLFELRAMHRF